LQDREESLIEQFGVRPLIVAVSDPLKGSVYKPDGLSPSILLDAAQTGRKLDNLPGVATGWDAQRTIAESNANVIVELSYTNLQTGEPALSHLRQALGQGQHVITTNKGPIALRYPELSDLAYQHGAEIGIEGTVMSGTPVLRIGQDLLDAAHITRIQGIVNGTTNYILTQMETGATYAAALAEAQEKGYAEADPTGDVEGYDAAGKVVILANVLMGASITLQDVDRQGITKLTPDDIASARANGQRWKLIARVEKGDGGMRASVRPTQLPVEHPLASVSGATNAITYTTDLLGDVTVIGPGAGRLATGYAILGDLLAIDRKIGNKHLFM
jgi:homoserine dehydrogenase